ncbi:MAG: hypothetical protein HRU12_09195 [Phaeodactylibacter sp.]|nr:hypothetical protein [Phaeodactylibacter sp.]
MLGIYSPKNLILLLALLWGSFALKAQSCFIQEDDATGSIAFSTAQLAELEAAACSLRAVFPTEFQDDFAVYDFGFYLHQQGYEGGMPQVFQDKIAEVEQESPYFLLFGRELSNNSGLGRIWVEVRLPEGSGYPCATVEKAGIITGVAFEYTVEATFEYRFNKEAHEDWFSAFDEVAARRGWFRFAIIVGENVFNSNAATFLA